MKTKNKRNPVPLAASVSASGPPDGEEVARRAYVLWEQEGCPSGRDLDYWLKAEAELGQGCERLSQ